MTALNSVKRVHCHQNNRILRRTRVLHQVPFVGSQSVSPSRCFINRDTRALVNRFLLQTDSRFFDRKIEEPIGRVPRRDSFLAEESFN